jgi:CRISPR/Cas system CSM-associated protein Csm4 (group 5 of RAMP superfamily)
MTETETREETENPKRSHKSGERSTDDYGDLVKNRKDNGETVETLTKTKTKMNGSRLTGKDDGLERLQEHDGRKD